MTSATLSGKPDAGNSHVRLGKGVHLFRQPDGAVRVRGMRAVCAVLFVASVSTVAFATVTNVWTNASGNFLFNTANNWKGNTVPANGECLSFPTDVTATNDIANLEVAGIDVSTTSPFTFGGKKMILTGKAGVEKAVGALAFDAPLQFDAGEHRLAVEGNLTLRGGISGSGNIEVVCQSFRSLNFTRSNSSFTGDIWATNSILQTSTGYVMEHTGKNNNVHVRRWVISGNWNALASNLFIYESTGGTDTSGILDYCSKTGVRGNLAFVGGTTRLARYNSGDPFQVTGNLSLPKNGMLYPYVLGANVGFRFDGIVSGTGFYTTGGYTGTYTFNAARNTFSKFQCCEGGANVIFAKPDGMPHELIFEFHKDTGYLSVAGDQTCCGFMDNGTISGDKHFVTSTIPSTITMTGKGDYRFSGSLLGDLGVTWNPDADNRTYALTGSSRTHTMTGALTVERGKMTIATGTAFPNLSAIVVGDGATLTIPAGVTVNALLESVTLGKTARLELAEGVALTPTYFFVGGEKMRAGVTYAGTDGVQGKTLSQIVGIGTVTPRRGVSGMTLILK